MSKQTKITIAVGIAAFLLGWFAYRSMVGYYSKHCFLRTEVSGVCKVMSNL